MAFCIRSGVGFSRRNFWGRGTRGLFGGSPEVCVLAIDQDPEAKARAAAFKGAYGKRFQFHYEFCPNQGTEGTNFDGILVDFGLSSFQLDHRERGLVSATMHLDMDEQYWESPLMNL